MNIMSELQAPPSPALSVVIPLLNEAGNVSPLIEEIRNALKSYPLVGENFEIVCVDDGSTDTTAAEAWQNRQEDPRVRLIRHARRLGMSAALRNGIRRANSFWVLTIDGDRQNDPADIPKLCDIAWDEDRKRRVLVGGLRVNRRDTLGKQLASRFANGIRRFLLNDDCPDTGCSLKLFWRDTYLDLPFFLGLHRFMPALFKLYGHETIFVPVNDRPRKVGVTKSDFLGRGVRGFFDLLGVIWLVTRTPKPDRGKEQT